MALAVLGGFAALSGLLNEMGRAGLELIFVRNNQNERIVCLNILELWVLPD